MEAMKDMDSKIVAKGPRKVLLMSFKMVYRLVLWRKASRMKKKRLAILEVGKMKAETHRLGELHREDKRDQEDIEFKIAQKREENKVLLEYDARMRGAIDRVVDILDDQRIRVQSFREMMMAQQNEEKQAFTGYEGS